MAFITKILLLCTFVTFPSCKYLTDAQDSKQTIAATCAELTQIHHQTLENATESLASMALALERQQRQMEQMMSMLSRMQGILNQKVNLGDLETVDVEEEFDNVDTEDDEEPISGTDCTDIAYRIPYSPSGVYLIKPDHGQPSFKVSCDMATDDGGWTVIQRRLNGSTDFYRGWNDYKRGFGNLETENWLGLENVHRLTRCGHWELRIDLEYYDGKIRYAKYDDFYIGSEAALFTLHIGAYNGTAKDQLKWNNNHAFTTKDSDHDKAVDYNCAEHRQSAWWYKYCTFVDLNGVYNAATDSQTGIVWFPWKGDIKTVEMKIRRLI